MNPLPDRDPADEQPTRTPRDERRHLTQRVDAVAKEVGRVHDDVDAVAQDVRALRQEVHALHTVVEELLRRTRPAQMRPPQLPMEPGATRRFEVVVYLGAGLAVAVIAVLLAIYLFTGT